MTLRAMKARRTSGERNVAITRAIAMDEEDEVEPGRMRENEGGSGHERKEARRASMHFKLSNDAGLAVKP